MFPCLFQVSRLKSRIKKEWVFTNVIDFQDLILDRPMLSVWLESILQRLLNFKLSLAHLVVSLLIIWVHVNNKGIKKLRRRHDITFVKPLHVLFRHNLLINDFFPLLLCFLIVWIIRLNFDRYLSAKGFLTQNYFAIWSIYQIRWVFS